MTESRQPPTSVSGSGPLVILVPGMEGTDRLFYRQVPLLSTRFTTATVSFDPTIDRMAALVADLDRVVAGLAPSEQPPILIGESFGGTVVLSYALAHPGRVRGLVVINSFPYFAPQWRLHAASTLLRLMPIGMMSLVRRLTARRLHSAHTHRADIERFMEVTRQMSREGYLNRLRILRTYDVRGRLRELQVPVLFLAADGDRLVPAVEQAQLMTRLTPGATMQVLSGHGHICLIAPDLDLCAILCRWIPAACATEPSRG